MSVDVLIVDDEPSVADRFASKLEGHYTVTAVYSGEAALEAVDTHIDVALLDRKMPGLSGGELLERLRAEQIDCQVAMVTGVDPGFDILDMPFDEYLTKPVAGDELRETVERLSKRAELDDALQEYSALVSKRIVLENELPSDRLAQNQQFHQLTAEIDQYQAEIETLIDDLDNREVFDVIE
jgi:DNA-binding response OmpR family regulator